MKILHKMTLLRLLVNIALVAILAYQFAGWSPVLTMIASLTTMSKSLCNKLAASTGACRFCGGETLLPEPTRYVVGAQGFNDICAVHEYFAMLGPTEDWNYPCQENRAMLSEKWCVGPPSNVSPSLYYSRCNWIQTCHHDGHWYCNCPCCRLLLGRGSQWRIGGSCVRWVFL